MKFNKKTNVTTHEGGKAVNLDSKTELVKLCLTSFMENTFYETQADVIERLNTYLERVDSTFIMKLAIFSRNYGLRSINHYLIAYWTFSNAGKMGMRITLKND